MLKKVLILAVAALSVSACASLGTKNNAAAAKDRAVPSFFSNGETAAAFKVDSVIRDMPLEGVLIVKKTDNAVYSIKIMGPLGAKIVDGAMDDNGVSYDYVLPDINTGLIKSRFEKFIFALLRPAGEIKKAHFNKDGTLEIKRKVGDGNFTYFYDENAAYPSKMQSGAISMNFTQYQPYLDGQLPHALAYFDSLADVSLGLTLISIR
ncbi:MAG: hypothetical protein LBI01_04155 [Elusimicrobium sp.]|jgi:hypothetical protein|nr:hypothetical protein [Elusimicrobium sp.]